MNPNLVPHYKVTISDPKRRSDRTGSKPWRVTVRLAGLAKTRHFKTKVEADVYRNGLVAAKTAGSFFDMLTGQPGTSIDLLSGLSETVLEAAEIVCRQIMGGIDGDEGLAPGGRKSKVQRISWAVVGLTPELPAGVPVADAYRVLVQHLKGKQLTKPSDVDVLRSLRASSMQMADVGRVSIEGALAIMATNCDGKRASTQTVSNRKQGLSHLCADFAERHADAGVANPMSLLPKSRRGKRVQKTPAEQVSPSVIGSPEEMWRILERARADAGGSLRVLSAVEALEVMVSTGCRPEEVAGLRGPDCAPGIINFARTVTTPGSDWSDGSVKSVGPLKHRAEGVTRGVPVPTKKVSERVMARARTTPRGEWMYDVTSGDLSRVWKAARDQIADGSWADEKLGTPYACRHSWASHALNGGMPPQTAADRLGHDVATLIKTYAAVVRKDDQRWTDLMAGILGEPLA